MDSFTLGSSVSDVFETTHHQGTGRQIGNVQLELRDLRTQLKHHERLRSSEDVEIAFLTSRKWSVLYTEADNVICMNPENYDQISVPRQIFGQQSRYLASGVEATVESYEGEAVQATLPVIVELDVVAVEAEVHDGLRTATLSSGLVVKLPAFVRAGDVINFNTREGVFVKRVRNG